MDNLIPMRWRTLVQREWQKIQLLAYQRSSGTSIERVTLFQPGRGNPWNTSAAVSNSSLDSMGEAVSVGPATLILSSAFYFGLTAVTGL